MSHNGQALITDTPPAPIIPPNVQAPINSAHLLSIFVNLNNKNAVVIAIKNPKKITFTTIILLQVFLLH